MDLSNLDTGGAKGAVLHLKHPATNEPLMTETEPKRPIALDVVCQDSERFTSYAHAQTDKTLAAIDPAQPRKPIPSAVQETQRRKLVAHCIVGFDNIVLDGQELPYSPENALKLVTRFPWIYEQVDAFAAQRANFLKASSPKP